VDKYLCYRDNTLVNHQLTWTSSCVTETILWWTINLRGQVFVLQRQYFDVIPEHRLPPYLPTMLITCCALCLYHIYTHHYISFIFKWTVNSHPGRHVWNALVRVEVGDNCVHDLVQIQHLDMVEDDNTLMNHQLTWTSICATETILWWTINLREQVFV
jgi:hypothetical protein